MAQRDRDFHSTDSTTSSLASSTASPWSRSYAEKHRLARINDFPLGITPPRHVRIYRRSSHFIIQWWEKKEKRTFSERVDGDLVSAIARAREIDERLAHVSSSGSKSRRVRHDQLVGQFVADLYRRADAGEIDVATAQRYETALRYYLEFLRRPTISRQWRDPAKIDRSFRLEFASHLNRVQVTGNGHPSADVRPMARPDYVLDVVRGMFAWAADPDRGNLLPDGFRNPFTKCRRSRPVAQDPVGDPDITMPMAVSLISECDAFQLRVFAPLCLYGMRPGELGWLFYEQIDDQWLRVNCLAELDYVTKGRRDKRFPLVSCLRSLWQVANRSTGLVYHKRRLTADQHSVAVSDMSLTDLADEYQRRRAKAGADSALRRRRVRTSLMKQAGQLNYDHVEAEFGRLAQRLDWPRDATLKDLRHLFNMCLENAGVPLFFRKYFMGQSFGKTPIVSYTHLSAEKVYEQYQKALQSELSEILGAIEQRARMLRLIE